MSKQAAIQRKLWKAYDKVAKTLAENEFDIFRSAALTDPLSDEKWIARKPADFSKDYRYKKTADTGKSLWLCWVEGQVSGTFTLQQGDFLYNDQEEITYFIASREQHQDIQAIRCGNTITISRAGYSTTGGGYAPGDTEIATNVPCNIQEQKGTGSGLGYIEGQNYNKDALPSFQVHLWDPVNEIQLRDTLVDDLGRRFEVLTVDVHDLGTSLHCQVYTP